MIQLPLGYGLVDLIRRRDQYRDWADSKVTYEWLVEMRYISERGTTIVEVVPGCNEWEAAANAFFTRNIADHWEITNIERG